LPLAACIITIAIALRWLASASMRGLLFRAARLPAGRCAVRFSARCRTAWRRDAIAIAFGWAASRARCCGTPVFVALPLSLVALTCPFVALTCPFVALPLSLVALGHACGRSLAVGASGAHCVSPVPQAVAERVDLAAHDSKGSCLAGLDEPAFHLLGQLRELRGRAKDLCPLLEQAACRAAEASAPS
jgi:hypothetical protein